MPNSSTKDTGRGLGFYLPSQDKIQQVQKLAVQIEREFNGEAKTLALAHLYRENNLMMDAIATLETLVEEKQTTGVYRFLGNLYHQVQLSQLAEMRYLKAIELAENSNDLVGRAMAQSGLAEVLAARGSNQKAIELAREAIDAYATLGDTANVSGLQEKLNKWE